MSKTLINKWLDKLEISKWSVNTQLIDAAAVTYPDDLPDKDKFFIGIVSSEDALNATIFHDRELTEEDIVHELLHVKYPDWSEYQVNAETEKLLKLTDEKVFLIYHTESTGRKYLVAVTNNTEKWLEHNNSSRDEENAESLSDFQIVKTELLKF